MIREKRRRQKLWQKVWLGILVFVVLMAIALFVVVKVFVVKTVKVEGNVLYDEQLIVDTVLNDEYSWNSLYVLMKYTFIDIDEVPFIDTMEISLSDPQTLKIKVYEKGMLGYLYIPAIGENAYFDKDGFVVETSTRIIENVPKIQGISCDEVVLYEKLPIDSQKLRELLTLTQALKREKIEPDTIDFGLARPPVLSYGNKEVWLGSIESLTQKVTRLKEILPKLEGVAGILHMENWSEENANIIFEKELEMVEDETQDTGDDTADEIETPQDDDSSQEN